jgi:hypothetical protein
MKLARKFPTRRGARPMSLLEYESTVRKVKRNRDRIAQYFLDVDHWNESVRKPDEERISADPDGEPMEALSSLSHFLERMSKRRVFIL